jgi:hypothetical protein
MGKLERCDVDIFLKGQGMDWIKVKTKHILREYGDLSDSEFRAWIKIMALTADLEHIPTHDQMIKEVHYKTLDSLQCKLNTRSIDLQYILNKVSIDVQDVANRKLYWRTRKQELRKVTQNVHKDIQETSKRLPSADIDKNENKNKNKIKHIAFSIPEWIKKETWDAFIEMRKSIGAKPTTRAQELLISKLNNFRLTGQDPNSILDQSTMNNWKGVFAIKQEVQTNVGIRTNRSDPRDKNLQSREDAECAAITAKWEAAKKSTGCQAGGNADNDDAPDFQGV